MGHSPTVDKVEPKKFELSGTGKTILFAMMGLGLLCFVAGYATNQERVWHAYMTSYFFFSSLCLGGLFFTALQHVANAGWSVNIRRICESFSAFLPVVLLGGVLTALGGSLLFLWMDASVVANDPILMGKSAYLNKGAFIFRTVLFGLIWWFFSTKIVGYSLKQDEDGDVSWTKKMVPWSVGFTLVFALSFSLYSIDMMMSLEPHWFSTIFGVYCLAGAFQSALAMMILFVLFCQSKGWVTGLMTIEHVHDLAKYLKGFTIFWAYIAFSQFMLIWYANLPEETIFFLHRGHGGWMLISMSLLVFKFIVPFVALLPRWAKRTPGHLVAVCLLVLVMQYVDIYWLVYPNYTSEYVAFSWMEVGTFVGFLGLFLFLSTRFLNKNNLVPIKDPRIHESLSHHVTY